MKQNTTYKQTELGLIPEDWEVKKFNKFSKFYSGGTPLTSKSEYYGGEIPFIKSGEIYYDRTEQFLTQEGLNNSSAKLVYRGDLLYALYGANSGEVAISQLEGAINQAILCIQQNKDEAETIYLYNYLKLEKSNIINKFLQGGQGNLSADIIKNLQIPLPPLSEQKKIADCLSTWDCAIEKQNALINALTQRKKALMQQLLTGKKRLPGFSGEWKEVKLGDIGEISSAGVDKNIVEGEKPIRLLNFLDVYRRDFLYSHEQNHWVTANDYKIEKCSIKKGDVFFTPSSEVPNDIAISAVAMENFDNVVYSYHIVRFRIKEKWDLRYKAYAFKTDEFFKQAQRICDGSGQRYVISQNNFKNIKIKIPSLEEQTAIAEILATADRELALQKEKLAQLQTQKKGLMQVLLTGKKRLIN